MVSLQGSLFLVILTTSFSPNTFAKLVNLPDHFQSQADKEEVVWCPVRQPFLPLPLVHADSGRSVFDPGRGQRVVSGTTRE